MESVNTINDLKNSINPANETDVFVKGYYAANDGGGGNFYWDANAPEPENNGTIFQSSFTTSGRWKRIYDVSVNVLWFGAKKNSDSGTDQTITSNAIQNAINLFSNSYGEVIIPSGTYYLNGNLTTNTGVQIKGIGNPTLIRTGTFTSKTIFITIGETTNPVKWTYSKIAIQGLIISTTDEQYVDIPNALFKSNLNALSIATSQFQVLDCSIFGFDKAVEFESGSFIVTFQGCGFRQNNYGIYFDATNKTELGENICFIHCTIAGNQYGIYNKLGGLYFNNCSIDYNNKMHIKDNISKISGTLSLKMVLDNCHIENSVARAGTGIRMKNSGALVISNSLIDDTLLEDTSTSNSYIENNDILLLTNNTFRMNEGRYFAKGNGIVSVQNSIPIANDQIVRTSIHNAGLRNGSFDLVPTTNPPFNITSIGGWSLIDGYNASVVDNNTFDSNYALKLSPTDQYTGTAVISDFIEVPVNRFAYIVTGYTTNSNHQGYCTIYLYDKDKNEIDLNWTQLFSNTKFKAAKKNIAKTVYLRIKLSCEYNTDTSKYIYIDDVCLNFLTI